MKDLSKNENQYPPSPLVDEVLSKGIETKYYLREPQLALKIAECNQVAPDQIYIANGAEQVLIDIFQSLAKKPKDKRKVLLADYSWPFYDFYLCDAEAIDIRFNLGEDFEYITAQIIQKYQESQPSLIILCSPNNPTSSIIQENELEILLSNIDNDCVVIIDETYKGFTNDEPNYISLFAKYKNLIIVRSFSKFYGLAGIRLGYGLIHPETKTMLKLPSNRLGFSNFIEKLGIAALDSTNYYQEIATKIMIDRDNIIKAINATNLFQAYPSNTNFIFMKSPPEEIEKLVMAFESQDLKIFVFKDKVYGGYIRFGIGLPEDTNKIISIFNNFDRREDCKELTTIFT